MSLSVKILQNKFIINKFKISIISNTQIRSGKTIDSTTDVKAIASEDG